jgi:hypothetical protein
MLYVLQVLSRSAQRCQSEGLNKHTDVVAELFGCVSTELRGGFAHAVDTFVGFFHAADWKVHLLPFDSLASTWGWFYLEVAGALQPANLSVLEQIQPKL